MIDIISAIDVKVGNMGNNAWYIGITNDPDRRKREHARVRGWEYWDAGSKEIATLIEDYFTDRGMNGGGGGGNEDSKYVYVYY